MPSHRINKQQRIVELSLNPLFRRDYNSLYKGIQEFLPHQTDDKYSERVNCLLDAVSQTIPRTKSRSFNLLGIDTTPYPRPYSATLADKTFIHYPNPIKGNKPISIGHTYSVVSALPDRSKMGNVHDRNSLIRRANSRGGKIC